MATLELNPIPTAESDAPKAPPTIADLVKAAIAKNTDIATLTTLYLKVRNSKSDLSDQAKKKLAPLNESLELIENHFLAKMLEMNVDSLKNAGGTPYKSEKTSISVGDNSAFLDYVLTRALSGLPVDDKVKATIKHVMIESGQLALVEARASKTAVEALMEETKELPPGLNRRVETTVNVRAS